MKPYNRDELKAILARAVDRHNRIIRTNRLAAESIHRTMAEVEGRLTLYSDEAEKYYQDDVDVIQSGQAKLGIVELYRTPSGGKRWVQTDKTSYRDFHETAYLGNQELTVIAC